MHQYCSSYVYKYFVNQSKSETTLQCTNSSSELKAPKPSKSDHNVLSGKSFKQNTWQYNLVELIEGTKGISDKVTAEIKRFVTDFLEKRASKQELGAQVPPINDDRTKKRARPTTPVTNEESSTTLPPTSVEHIKKRTRLMTPTGYKEFRLELSSTSDEHAKKRTRPTTPATNEDKYLKKPKLDITPSGLSPIRQIDSTPSSHISTTGQNMGIQEHVENTHYNKIACKRIKTTTPFEEITGPLIQTRSEPNVTESQKYEKAYYNEKKLKEINTLPTRYDTPKAIQTSSRPCLNVSPDADGDDDELDNEVATILANGVPPTVGGYRPMPPTIDGYRPISEYYVPRLIQDREIKELEGEPMFLAQDGAYHQCGATLHFTRKPSKDAIKILNTRPCLYQNKKFGELEKVESIQTEDSSSFWQRTSN